MDKLAKFEEKELERLKKEKEIPNFKTGDTVRVYVRVTEQDKVRIHPFEGIVISIQGARHRKTFTVRKISFGEGVERTFPLYSPSIEKIEVLKRGKVRRKKLYYLRERVGKKAKVKSA